MDKLLPPSGMQAQESHDPNETETAISKAMTYKEQEKEKFIKYIESLGIFVNRRSNTAFSAKGRKDILDSTGGKRKATQRRRKEAVDARKRDVSVGMSGMSLERRSNS